MRRRLIIAVALVLLTATCATGDDEAASDRVAPESTTAPRGYVPRLTDADCPVEVPPDVTVTCSNLVVPEDRSRPDGRMVTLPVVRIHARGDRPAGDPVVFLHGGPGAGTLAGGIDRRTDYPTLAQRDLILFDQRGSGLATPALECPEREEALRGLLADDETFAAGYDSVRGAVDACHRRLIESGVDLSRYSTPDAAADVADLREALGLDGWNLWGVSYGTRLALEVMRSHPEGLRAVVLDSTYPPGGGSYDDTVGSGAEAIAALAAACAAETTCHDRSDDVLRDIRTVVGALDAEPYTFLDDSDRPMVVTGDDVVSGLFVALYDSSLIPLLPAAIHSLARENYALIPVLAATAIPFMNDVSEGAYLSYECADNARASTQANRDRWRERPGAGSLLLLAGWYLMCDIWDVDATPAAFDSPVASDIATLVVAGEFDPVTPAGRSEALAQSLDRALYVEVPRGGHTPGTASGCVREVIASFVDRPDRTDRTCLDAQDPVPFGI